MIKFILLIGLFYTSGYLGISIGGIYKNKINFYQDLLSFCKKIKTEISFLKTDVLSLVKYTDYNSKFADILNDYQKLIESNSIISEVEIKNILYKYSFLNNDDIKCLSQFFLQLGQVGYQEQLQNIEYSIETIDDIFEQYKQKNNKMVTLCNKMGFMFGLLVCIVLIWVCIVPKRFAQ